MISQIEQFPDDGNEYWQKNRQLQYMYNCSNNINFHCKCLIFDTTWIYKISLAWQKILNPKRNCPKASISYVGIFIGLGPYCRSLWFYQLITKAKSLLHMSMDHYLWASKLDICSTELFASGIKYCNSTTQWLLIYIFSSWFIKSGHNSCTWQWHTYWPCHIPKLRWSWGFHTWTDHL